MKKYKVAYATGSRADYGIVKNYIKLLNDDSEIEFSILVTGAHLEKKFGHTVDLIRLDGFQIEYEVPLYIQNGKNANVIHSMAIALDKFGLFFETHRFDLLIVLGDRYEIMAVAIAAAMQRIPILHLHGGEVTFGNYDEFIRHSITKMSQFHFTSTEIYRKRVIQLGENPNRVYCLGALGAENCQKIDTKKVNAKIKKLKQKSYWVILFHPETLTGVNVKDQIQEILAALDTLSKEHKLVFMGTNADTNSDIIRSEWTKYVNEHDNAFYFENLNVDSFLYLVKESIALVGNSSSGIIEAPSLGVCTINIGSRQKGRVHGSSVIDVECKKNDISLAMRNVVSYIRRAEKIENPYYVENTAKEYFMTTKKILLQNNTVLKEFYDLK